VSGFSMLGDADALACEGDSCLLPGLADPAGAHLDEAPDPGEARARQAPAAEEARVSR